MKGNSRRSNLAALLLLLPAVFGAPIGAQQSPPAVESTPATTAEIRFDFERPGLPVPKFSLAVMENGAGTYTAEETTLQAAQQIHRELVLTPATTHKIFALTGAVHLSTEVCASKAKNIADTGKKRITLTASGITASCTYNYSDNKNIQGLTDIFEGIAETMDMGRRLDFLHRFDRLGLNDAMGSLAEEVSAGHALEIETIAPSLRSLASDAEVMQRVRTRASALLALVPAEVPQSAR